jgi:L-lactate utilization protein LutB
MEYANQPYFYLFISEGDEKENSHNSQFLQSYYNIKCGNIIIVPMYQKLGKIEIGQTYTHTNGKIISFQIQ